MTASSLFFLLIVLACPLMMVFMMRGGHGNGHGGQGGHAGGCHGGHGQEPAPRETSTDDLRRRRADLDRLIEVREGIERDPHRELTPRGGSGR
jgi:hypothetical protein